ncbi:MAG: beta-1,6-galactofuranosyltransferase [Streptococcaceae bacterium]|jgi:hypothetical protein|nr:beta-1,6-galactofuranosyltransferase [Streptococcaceae bacterium]
MNYLTHTIEPWMPVGATKPKDDLATIARQVGWQILEIDRATQSDTATNLSRDLKAGDLVVHQFPSYLPLTFEENLQAATQARGASFVIFIHDFEPLRLTDRQDAEREYDLLRQADGLVVHTSEMADALAVPVPTFVLGLFDYLTCSPIPLRQPAQQLIFAGTLSKAEWLKEWQAPIKVFGKRSRKWSQEALNPAIDIQAILPQDSAPALLPDGIGLVWDSDSTTSTRYQAYQKLNSPHKLSLYLAAELPVILPSFSPFARFITENKLGATISKLSELPIAFDYDKAKGQEIGQQLRTGHQSQQLLQTLAQFYDHQTSKTT